METIGPVEMLIILAVVLLLFGSKVAGSRPGHGSGGQRVSQRHT
jgi:hypothetical protein